MNIQIKPTLYIDLDGVIVDFLSGVHAILGKNWDSFKTPEQKAFRNQKCFESGVSFWEQLPPTHDSYHLWSYVEPFKPEILTASPSGGDNYLPSETSTKYAKEGKWEWCKKHLHIPYDRFHCVFRQHKQDYATKALNGHIISNILIDDTAQNIQEWINNRGIGILHRSANETIAKLRSLGIINPAIAA